MVVIIFYLFRYIKGLYFLVDLPKNFKFLNNMFFIVFKEDSEWIL